MSRAETRHFTARCRLIVPTASSPAGKLDRTVLVWMQGQGSRSPTDLRRDRRKAAHKQRPAQATTTPTAVGAQSSPIPTTRPRKLQTACLPRAGGKERVTPRADTPPYT